MTSDPFPLPPATSMGPVRLRVGDLDRMAAFYERAIGLRGLGRGPSEALLGTGDGRVLVELEGDPVGPGPPARSHGPLPPGDPRPGPGRPGRRAAPGGRRGLVVHGRVGPPRERGALPRRPRGQRHRDLPRPPARGVAARRRRGARDGDLPPRPAGRPRRRLGGHARRGHARRHGDGARPPPGARRRRGRGASTPAALGFDVTVRGYPGALFVSAGGYHHHLGPQHLGHARRPAAAARRARPGALPGAAAHGATTSRRSPRASTRRAWPPSRATAASSWSIPPATARSWPPLPTDPRSRAGIGSPPRSTVERSRT